MGRTKVFIYGSFQLNSGAMPVGWVYKSIGHIHILVGSRLGRKFSVSVWKKAKRNHPAIAGIEPLLPHLLGLQRTCTIRKLAISSCASLEGSKIGHSVYKGSPASFSFLTTNWWASPVVYSRVWGINFKLLFSEIAQDIPKLVTPLSFFCANSPWVLRAEVKCLTAQAEYSLSIFNLSLSRWQSVYFHFLFSVSWSDFSYPNCIMYLI